jgi:dimeric dUTPase (all-alpha-NTP-PPase superfamily)
MNLNDLHPIQEKLDDRIREKHNLQEVDLTKKKTEALICELWETTNEARFFKFWSEDQRPRTEFICELCEGLEEISVVTAFGTPDYGFDTYEVDAACPLCEDVDDDRNPLLEEYVDTVHFTISLANDLGYTEHEYKDPGHMDMNDLVLGLTQMMTTIPYAKEPQIGKVYNYVIKYGYLLGFDEEAVREAYFAKNEINHARQTNGY